MGRSGLGERLRRGSRAREREHDAEGRAAAGRLDDVDRAVVRRDDRRDDREPEARAARLTGARRVGTPEPLEDLLADLRAGCPRRGRRSRAWRVRRRRRSSRGSRCGLSSEVNRIALPMRFVMTWRILFSSASTIARRTGLGRLLLGGGSARDRRGRRVDRRVAAALQAGLRLRGGALRGGGCRGRPLGRLRVAAGRAAASPRTRRPRRRASVAPANEIGGDGGPRRGVELDLEFGGGVARDIRRARAPARSR